MRVANDYLESIKITLPITVKRMCDAECKFMHYLAEARVYGRYQCAVGQTEEEALESLKNQIGAGIAG